MGSFTSPIVTPALSRDNLNEQLSPLESNNYSFSSLTYPIDLGSDPAVNHYVVFFVNESSNTNFTTGQGNNINGQPVPNQLQQQSQIVKNRQSTINQNQNADARPGVPSLNIPRNTTRVPLGIALYMPPSIVTQQQTPWGNQDLGLAGAVYQDLWKNEKSNWVEKMQSVLKDVVQDIGHDLGKGLDIFTDKQLNISGVAGFGLRAAYNPHAEVLFRGVNFRSFNFQWQFFPRTQDEAKAVYNIIQAFKFYAAPEVNVGAAGRFFIYPAEFDIKFFSNGDPNNFLNKISTCALVNVAVNYTGNGMFSSFIPGDNGMNGVTTETHLSLDFVELEIMHKKRILEGY